MLQNVRFSGVRAMAGLAGVIAFLLLGAPAQAQSNPERGPNAAGENGNLSEKLEKSNGVIKPREDVDPRIAKPTPPERLPTPVIPPPGSPGGDPDVQPK